MYTDICRKNKLKQQQVKPKYIYLIAGNFSHMILYTIAWKTLLNIVICLEFPIKQQVFLIILA